MEFSQNKCVTFRWREGFPKGIKPTPIFLLTEESTQHVVLNSGIVLAGILELPSPDKSVACKSGELAAHIYINNKKHTPKWVLNKNSPKRTMVYKKGGLLDVNFMDSLSVYFSSTDDWEPTLHTVEFHVILSWDIIIT